MPKLQYKITEFHGGTNSNADAKDLLDNEQPYTRDVDVSKHGLIKVIPEAYPLTAKEKGSNEWSSGVNNYGLFFFGADNKPTDNSDGNFTLAALYDGRYVDIYCGGTFDDWNSGGEWANNEIDFTAGSGSSQPLFYFADGVLRVYDRALANVPKWYGHIKPERFAGITNINSGEASTGLNDWISTNAAPTSPTTGYAVMSTPQVGSEATSTNPDYDDQNGGLNSSASEYIGVVSAEFCATNSVNLRVGLQVTESSATTASVIAAYSTDSNSVTDSSEIIPFVGATGNTPNTSIKIYPDNSVQKTYWALSGQTFTIDESTSVVIAVYVESANLSKITSWNFRIGTDSSNYYRWNYGGSAFKAGMWNLVVMSMDKHTAVTGSPSEWGETFPYVHVDANSAAADTDEPSWYQSGVLTVPVSDTLTGFPEGEYTFHYTWLYDDSKQESLPFEYADPDTASNKDSAQINILGDSVLLEFQSYITIAAANNYGIDKRITGSRLYYKIDSNDNYFLIGEIDFIKKGFKFLPDSDTMDYSIANCADTSSDPLTFTGVIKGIKPTEANIIDTFKTVNGFSTKTNSISAEYKTATIQGKRAYVGNIKQDADGDGTAEIYEDRMLRSQVNKYDTFPSDLGLVDVAIRDGESIVKLESFNDRILQFKQRTLYIINVSESVEFLEDTYHFKGIGFPYHAVRTDIGVAFFNQFGCFLYDGRNIIDLLERQGRKTFDQEDFEDFVNGDNTDTDYSETHIAYLPEQKQLLLTNDLDDVLIYDFTYMAWITRGVDRVNISGAKRSNLQLDWKSRLCYVTGNNGAIEYWQESGDTKNLEYRTKVMDFGEPGLKKNIYKVLVTYKGSAEDVSVYYGTNGSSALLSTFNNDTTPMSYSASWTTITLKPTNLLNNIYSMQLKFKSSNVIAGTADSGASTYIEVESGDSQADDYYNNKIVRIVAGTGVGQSRRISDYNGTNDRATVASDWTTTPSSDSQYEIGWQDSTFQINDITIFYRLKPPGAGA